MVDFRSPAVLALNSLSLDRLSHTMDGIYLWEFFTTLYFEWRVIQGRRPYRWTIWVYSLARLSALSAVMNNATNIITVSPTNCQLSYTLGFISAYIAFAFSTLLLVLRTVAIWNRNKVVVVLVTVVWVTNLSFIIQGAIKIRSTVSQEQDACSIPNVKSDMATIISLFITDIVLLVVMLIGLLRMARRGTSTFSLGRLGSLLWKQGLVWLFLATTIELLPLVFLCLDLDDAFNMMFLMPSLVLMTITSTRMYRSLADFSSATEVAMDSETLPRVVRAVGKLEFSPRTPSQLTEVVVDIHGEQHQITLADHDSHDIGNDRPEQLHDKPHSLSFDNDVERCV